MNSVLSHASLRPVARIALRLMLLVAMVGLVPAGAALADDAQPEQVVNINTATPAQLGLLPGIGPSRAERIVDYRAKHPFKDVVELARVKGIGLKTVRKLKPWLRVSGPTTLATRIPGQAPRKRGAKATGSVPAEAPSDSAK